MGHEPCMNSQHQASTITEGFEAIIGYLIAFHDISINPKVIKMKTSILRKVKVLICQSPVNPNIPTELLAFPVFQIVGKNGPADHLRPPNAIFPHIFYSTPKRAL